MRPLILCNYVAAHKYKLFTPIRTELLLPQLCCLFNFAATFVYSHNNASLWPAVPSTKQNMDSFAWPDYFITLKEVHFCEGQVIFYFIIILPVLSSFCFPSPPSPPLRCTWCRVLYILILHNILMGGRHRWFVYEAHKTTQRRNYPRQYRDKGILPCEMKGSAMREATTGQMKRALGRRRRRNCFYSYY